MAAQLQPTVGSLLVDSQLITAERLGAVQRQALETGQDEVAMLVKHGHISKWDALAARGTIEQEALIPSLDDLPEWGEILNDAGGVLGSAVRDPRVAVIGPSSRVQTESLACFLVTTAEYRQSTRIAGTTGRALQHGYTIANTLVVPHQNVLDLLYRVWDEQRGVRSADGKSAETSDLQKEFDEIGYKAFKRGASDIHITAARGRGIVRIRVHGELENFITDRTEEWAESLCAMAYNTLAERGSTKDGFNPRITQDAVIERIYPEGMIRYRYSGLPIAPAGFDVTLRIIPIGVSTKRLSLSTLGYSPDQCDAITRIFAHSSGLVLISGTTGSGKSTTLANMLMKMATDHPGKKIRTVEEPVEYRIDGAYQTAVTRINGDSSDFLTVLRAMMRADPDVIMVGEIRDHDTADLAIQAVRSGHLCVSTIHADGAPVCYDRLSGMGIDRLDMASIGLVAGLIYQKLVPVLCDACKLPAERAEASSSLAVAATLARARKVNHGSLDGIFLRNHEGCPACDQRGITGRTVCAEILRPTPDMLDGVSKGDSRRVWKLWRQEINADDPDMMVGKTAFEHGIWKMRQGVASPVDVEKEFRFLDEDPTV